LSFIPAEFQQQLRITLQDLEMSRIPDLSIRHCLSRSLSQL